MSAWKKISTRDIHRARTADEISFREDEILLPDGNTLLYVYAHSPYEVVFVVGIDAEGRVILLRQHRHLVQKEVWEIPAGSPEGEESLVEGALREFEEESGFSAGQIRHLTSFYPSVGITDQVNHVFVAWDLRESEQNLESGELIKVHPTGFDEAIAKVYAGEIENVGAAYSLLFVKNWWSTSAETRTVSESPE